MPRRKKSGQSPARVPGGPPDGEAFGYDAGYRAPLGYDSGMATNFSQSSSVPASDRENIVRGMREMFSHLEPEVIHIVLSECDFKVENAMDSLLELSRAAENAAPNPSPVSGFERTAAALLSPEHFSAPGPCVSEAQQQQQQQSRLSPSPSANLLTDELDLLLDQELQTLTEQEHGGEEGQRGSQYPPAGASFPSCPPLPQQLLPELLQSSLGSGSSHSLAEQPCPDLGHLLQGISGTSSSLDQLSSWPEETTGDQQSVVDFSHLLTETPTEKPKPPLDLAASSRPSAFQVYKKQEQSHGMDKTTALTSEGLETGAKANRKSPWNLDSPEFLPRASGNQGPYFLTPVAPSHWTGQIRHTSPWLGHSPVSQAPLKPSATIPKSWAMPAASQPPSRSGRLHLEGKVLVLLRGPPGSGKSFLARALQQHNPDGVVLSTDDYYYQNGEYRFDPATLGVAHEWNHKRAKEAFEKGTYPIIIDNTNMQGWEMRPYVVQALRHNYKVLFREPDTWWKNKPRELERRTTHNVSVETIRRMINGYERFVTVQSIMGSAMPERKQLQLLDSSENTNHKPVTSETLCPDLVRGPTLTEQCKNSRPHLFSSLPDVSSIGQSAESGMSEDSGCRSSDSLNIQPTGRTTGDSEREDNMDIGALDSELETNRGGEQRIPDCIVESVMSEDQIGAEIPVAFSESIGQRVRRERPSRRSEFNNRMSSSDLVRDTNQSEELVEKTEMLHAGEGRDTADKQMTFVGDWPAEPSLQQRQARRRERCQEGSGKDEGGAANDEDNSTKKGLSGPDLTEFQKLLDLIQTGEATHPTCSDSPILMVELEREIDAGDSFEKKHCDSRLELPDCVLDMDDREGLGSENGASIAPESNDDGNFLSVAQTSKVEEEEIVNVEGEGGSGAAGLAERDLETGAHLDSGSSVCDECVSPAGEASVEAESGVSGGTSAERKQRSGRRSGKQCKLALTFSSSLQTPECTNAATPQSPSSTDTEHSTGFRLLTTHFDPWEHPSPPPPVGSSRASQTEPQDFAFLWRINHQNGSEDTVVATSGHLKILSCPSLPDTRIFLESTAVASQLPPSDPSEVPYRVVHEKGTQVDEREFGPTRDRIESLRILSRHFKLVSFDTLEDLYDKCHHDLEWTTNLLLDSGERFFRDEDGEDEESEAQDELRGWNGSGAQGGLLASDHSGAQGEAAETELGCSAQQEPPSDGVPETESAEVAEVTQPSTCETSSLISFGDEASAEESTAITTQAQFDPPSSELEEKNDADIDNTQEASQHGPRGGAWGWRPADDGVIVEECRVELDDEIATMEEINRLLQEELDQEEKHGRGERERGHTAKRRPQHLDIQSLELKLPTELALQLTELFGPVGVDPGTCSPDDYAVQMDLSLAKLLHQKWKDSIQESQRQAALSFHLLQESSVHWGESQPAIPSTRDQTARFLLNADGYASASNAPDHRSGIPFMDHWNVSRQHVSLRDIIREEQALQENVEKSRQSRADLDKRDGATLLKEQQLYSHFPTIDRHFLQDIFRDHKYCLMETELFLNSLLGEEPVKTVVAPEAPRSDHHRTASKEREKRQKALESSMLMYQDTEDPEYEDFRAEADLQRSRQMESFSKAAEAHKQGRKDVAAFYADQGRMHGQRMREANHRAAVQIFERVNASLLPRNILDLHGLHVDEALHHLGQVLQDKTADCEQGLCQPRLSVITGRGNHSQGGVARIRPAVIDYLTNKHYRFAEPKAGLVLVSLK